MAEKFKLSTFIQEVKDELNKIEWPSKEQTIGATAVVAVVVFILTIYLGVVDNVFNKLASAILG